MYPYAHQNNDLVSTPLHLRERENSEDETDIIHHQEQFKPYFLTELNLLAKTILKILGRYYKAGMRPGMDGELTTAWSAIVTLFVNIWSKNRLVINPLVELSFNIPITILTQLLSMADYYGYINADDKNLLSWALHALKRGTDGITPMMVTLVLLAKLAGALFTVYQCGKMTQKQCDKTSEDNNLLLASIVFIIITLSCSSYIAATGAIGKIKNRLRKFPFSYGNQTNFNGGIPFCGSAANDQCWHLISNGSYRTSEFFKFLGNAFKYFAIGFGSTYMSMLLGAQLFPNNPVAKVLAGPAVTAAEAITFPTISVAGVYGIGAAALAAKNVGRNFFNNLYYFLAFYALTITDIYNTKNAYDTHHDRDNPTSQAITIMIWIYVAFAALRVLLALIPPRFLSKKVEKVELVEPEQSSSTEEEPQFISLEAFKEGLEAGKKPEEILEIARDKSKVELVESEQATSTSGVEPLLKQEKSSTAVLLSSHGLYSNQEEFNSATENEQSSLIIKPRYSDKRKFCGVM